MRVAALYVQGRVVLGSSHLDAFEQLSDREKDSGELADGFYDPETGEFYSYIEHDHFFHKKIMLVRHGRARNDDLDPGLSHEGITEVTKVARQMTEFDLGGFVAFTSPLRRCLETARIVCEHTGLSFSVRPDLMETPSFLCPGETYFVHNRSNLFPNFGWPDCEGWNVETEPTDAFRRRVGEVLRGLPIRSMLVSHRGVVTNMARMALCDEKVNESGVPTASLTYIEDQQVRCLGRTPDEDTA